MTNSKEIGYPEQYSRLAEDWRHLNSLLWQIPAVAVSIMGGIVVAASGIEGWLRIGVLGTGSIFLFALGLEVIKKRLLMSVTSIKLAELERRYGLKAFPSSTPDLLKYNQRIRANPDDKDPLYRIFKWSYARQYLTHVILVAAILVSALTEWEFYNYLENLKFHGYQWIEFRGEMLMIFIPVISICGFVVFTIDGHRREDKKNIHIELVDEDIKIVMKINCIKKDDIKVKVSTEGYLLKLEYHYVGKNDGKKQSNYDKIEIIEIPPDADITKEIKAEIKDTCLEITFNKKLGNFDKEIKITPID